MELTAPFNQIRIIEGTPDPDGPRTLLKCYDEGGQDLGLRLLPDALKQLSEHPDRDFDITFFMEGRHDQRAVIPPGSTMELRTVVPNTSESLHTHTPEGKSWTEKDLNSVSFGINPDAMHGAADGFPGSDY